jgi:hypothetical protein
MNAYGIAYLFFASLVFIGFAAWMALVNKRLHAENELLRSERYSLLKNHTPLRDEHGKFLKTVRQL